MKFSQNPLLFLSAICLTMVSECSSVSALAPFLARVSVCNISDDSPYNEQLILSTRFWPSSYLRNCRTYVPGSTDCHDLIQFSDTLEPF
jgi:hypothetical protein